MRVDDFFMVDTDSFGDTPALNGQLLDRVRAGTEAEFSDVEVAGALVRLVRQELEAYGTGGGERITDDESRTLIRLMRRVLKRSAVEFELPFSDFSSWHGYWVKNEGYGSYQARRDILHRLFDDLQ